MLFHIPGESIPHHQISLPYLQHREQIENLPHQLCSQPPFASISYGYPLRYKFQPQVKLGADDGAGSGDWRVPVLRLCRAKKYTPGKPWTADYPGELLSTQEMIGVVTS